MIRVILLALLALPTFGHAACPNGTYAVVGQPLLSTPAAVASDAVTIAGGTVAIASGCPATAATIRSTKRGTLVVASWPQCGDALRVRLRAFVDKSCGSMRGRFVTRKPRSIRRFVAEQASCESGTPGCGACGTNFDCALGEYCAKPAGACDARGTCEPTPTGCSREHVPVCGCDGFTYSNRCNAASSQTSVAHAGPCEARCGGIEGLPCADDEFCELPPRQCGGVDLEGRCVAVPETCPLAVIDPVCGCDGVTYSQDCERRAARAQKAHAGRCRDECTPDTCEAKVCGGIAGIPCDDGEVCELPAGECQSADLQGECVAAGGACTADFRPVCGCDGVTYSNDCTRRRAGIQKANDGPC